MEEGRYNESGHGTGNDHEGVGSVSWCALDCLTGVEGHCYIRPRFVGLIWIL